jgi:plastocyanin
VAYQPDEEDLPPPSRWRAPRTLGQRLAGLLLLVAFLAFGIWMAARTLSPEQLSVATGGLLGHERQPKADPETVVEVYEYGFTPSRLVVEPGEPVAWHDIGDDYHEITPSTKAGKRVFKAARNKGSARHIFKRSGVYPYYCAIHPQMRGTVVVRAPSTAKRS